MRDNRVSCIQLVQLKLPKIYDVEFFQKVAEFVLNQNLNLYSFVWRMQDTFARATHSA